jgi:hypothetical protein
MASQVSMVLDLDAMINGDLEIIHISTKKENVNVVKLFLKEKKENQKLKNVQNVKKLYLKKLMDLE